MMFLGPEAAKALQDGVKENVNDLYFMNGVTTEVFGIPDVRVTRCGYTGEDGFEVWYHEPPGYHCYCSLAIVWLCIWHKMPIPYHAFVLISIITTTVIYR